MIKEKENSQTALGAEANGEKMTVRSVERALAILNIFSYNNKSLTFTELWQESQLPKATAFRLINTLVEQNYLKYDAETNKYSLGLQIAYLGYISIGSLDLPKAAYPIMEELRDLTGHTITLYIRRGKEKVCIQKVESCAPIRLTAYVGMSAPVYAGASGLVLLSDMNDEQLNEFFDHTQLIPLTELTIIDKRKLLEAVHKVRQDGYYVSMGERQNGAAGIGAPIYNIFGQVVASLNISGPVERFLPEKMPEWIDLVKRYAGEISTQLGYRPYGTSRG